MEQIYLEIALAPLIGAMLAGLLCRRINNVIAHGVTILGVSLSFLLSLFVLGRFIFAAEPVYNDTLYTWAIVGSLQLEVGFLVDELTALMMVVVTSVSLLVHIYTIGYMRGDPGYNRFFSYISLFTFAMLMLVMSNNFLQLFFGWEAVGLVSYLLIGFWFKRPTAIFANMKAFLVNRVGDFGFLLGIAAIAMYAGSLDYQQVFQQSGMLAQQSINIVGDKNWGLLDVVCILLFIGAMGKSAQVPLHVWLPDSMEGPTPISALIHAATMVTAGVFMVARMSPLYEYSEIALNVILVIGAITALFMGLVGIVQNDIKRVVAYSTLSQLGYMTVALGASAYSVAIFHLMTHAFFKALLFLAAGSVIIGMHHEQDMRKMGGLYKLMPITYGTCLFGALALIGMPPFSGFYSKDMLIEAVHHSQLAAAGFAYYAVVIGVFITALYTFRMIFMTFHGESRVTEEARSHLQESPWVVTLPLVLLAIPSLGIGAFTVQLLLFDNFLGNALFVFPEHDVVAALAKEYHGPINFILHAFVAGPVLYLAFFGVFIAWLFYIHKPTIPAQLKQRFALLYNILEQKYGFDSFYQIVFASGFKRLANRLWRTGDVWLVDGLIVNGTAQLLGRCAKALRYIQTGYLYHYAFAMILGLLMLLGWTIWR